MKAVNSKPTCSICGGPVYDSDSEWLGEINGTGIIEISGGDCIDCGQHVKYPQPIRMSGF